MNYSAREIRKKARAHKQEARRARKRIEHVAPTLLAACEDLLSVLGDCGYFPAAGKPRTDAVRRAVAEAYNR